MKSKIKDIIAIIVAILIVIAFCTYDADKETTNIVTKDNTTTQVNAESKTEEIKEQVVNKEESKTVEEEKKSNLSNIKGYDLIYAISKYVGKDYNLKTNTQNGTTKYDIYIQEKYDVVMNVESKTDKVLSLMLTTYQDDTPFLKFANELFVDKTPIDEWITNNYKSQEEVKTVLDGYELLISTDSNGVTELSIAEEGFYDKLLDI